MGWLSTLVGAILGFGASLLPEVMSIVRAAYFHRFQMEAADAGHTELLARLDSQTAAISALTVQLQASPTPYQWTWIDIIGASVRPVITYLFFGMFFLVKMTALVYVLYVHGAVEATLPIIWDSETSGLFAAVISFWFGSRAMGAAAGTATQHDPVSASPSLAIPIPTVTAVPPIVISPSRIIVDGDS